MANTFSLSPYMSLPVPTVGQAAGPLYAQYVNNCLQIIDSHNHTPGSGQQITPAALNINADLPMGQNSVLNLGSLQFTAQGSPLSTLQALYVSGVDLYYTDGSGNQVRITQSGGVAGAPGSISNLTSPASASYVSANQTFVWQSAANTPANMDAGAVVLRNIVASSPGLTLQPPTLVSSYTLTLPALPVGQRFMTLDASGNMQATWNTDNSTVEISSNVLRVKPGGIGTTQLADASVTRPKVAARSVVQGSLTDTTIAVGATARVSPDVSITTSGGPVLVNWNSLGTTGVAWIALPSNGLGQFTNMTLYRNGTPIMVWAYGSANFVIIDAVAAGTYTYAVYATSSSSGSTSTKWQGTQGLQLYEML